MKSWHIYIILLIIFEIIADIFSIEYALGKTKYFLHAIICFVICNCFWLMALKNGAMLGRGAIIFSVSTAIIATIIGCGWYGEKLNNTQLLGGALGIVALLLLAGDKNG